MNHPENDEQNPIEHHDMAGHLIEFTRDGIVLNMRDDGPTNAFWAGRPEDMPEALRQAGLPAVELDGEDDADE